jgi:hypothetical protein
MHYRSIRKLIEIGAKFYLIPGVIPASYEDSVVQRAMMPSPFRSGKLPRQQHVAIDVVRGADVLPQSARSQA